MAIESVGGSVVSKIAELLVEPAIKQFRYMFCFNNFVQEFDEQMMNLALAFYRLQDAVNVAERNAEEIEMDVNTWLENAKNEIEGVNRLQNEKGKIIKCFTWCPNSIRQFKLSKALAKKTETLRKLEENSRKFPKVSHKAPLQEIKFLPSKEFTLSGSSKEAFKQIMKALKDDKVNMIGLYGMGGVGKTTLVKEVGRRAKELHLFDEVLIATVSQNPNVTGIQDQMADSLDLKFDKKSKEGRAKELWQRLQAKKMLIVLDDVWKDIDFQEIGIPFGDDHMGCKILLTTRLEDMCSYMKCKEKVFLGLFSEEEAWALFRINADLRDEDSTLNTVAKKVARECNGLPVALVTVGRALRDKSVVEWEVASEELKNSQFRHLEQIDGQKNAYACLKLSYDYVTSDETKSCFLLCCLFPEDCNIPIEYLTRYAVGYGLHKDAESIEDARKRVYVAIKNLKACCMLLGTESEEYVKMHDLVRDVAIRIASSEKYGFMVKAGIGLLEWPTSNKSFDGCTTMSLMGNKLAELPEELVCPQLKVLLLELDDDLNVPERFFEGMKAIEVLSLNGGCLSLQSLQFSTNLQSLLLIGCVCEDLIWLRKLQRLEILGFIWCDSVEELPDEIGELKELRLLDLTNCPNLRRIPVNLIARLKKLEELLMGDESFKGWDVVGCDSTEGMNASLTELSSLSHLAVLSLKIPKVECIPRDFVFPGLLKYDIVLGDWYSELDKEYPTSTRLYLGDISATSLNAKTFEQLFPTVSHICFWRVEGLRNIVLSSDQMTSHGHGSQKDFLQRLEYVKVKKCGDIRTLFPAKWRQALKNLRRVKSYDCRSLEEVFEFDEAEKGINKEKELPLLSCLTTLLLSNLPELKCIWKGPTRHVSLQSLINLKLSSLHKLTFIFTPSLAQSLIHLETLQIERCHGLKRLIREKDDEGEIIPESLGFPKLKKLSIRGCHYLEYVFPVSVSPSLQNLEEMEIREANNLKQVFYSGEGDDIIVKSKIKDGIIDFPQLRKLSLSKSSFFGPTDFAAQLPSLQCLSISGHEEWDNLLAQLRERPLYFSPNFFFLNLNCRIQYIVIISYFFLQISETKGLTSLETLILSSVLVPDLRCIWKGLMLSHLTSLMVYSCKRLTRVFTHSMIASLVQLKVLEISNCEELEQIIAKDNNDEKHQILSESDLQSACFPNLCRLQITRCNKLKSLFPIAMASGLKKLQILEVRDSSQLLGVFGQGDHASPVNVEKEMVLPVLQELLLIQLPSIFCCSLGCYDFLFPHLEKLKVHGCPKLTIESATTSNDSMSAQSKAFMNLKEISIGNLEGVQDLMQVGSLVTNISGRHELSLVSLETLHLNLLPDLRCIWKGLVPCNLTTVKVNECKSLTHVFTNSMIASLLQLKVLEISNCDELEQIIAKDNDDENDQILSGSDLQSSCFPKLYRLEITGCNKLKSLFPIAMASGLKKLQELKVRKSSQLLGVFGQGDHASPVNVEKEMVLLDLQWLALEKLPSIVHFSHGCYDFIFPRLWWLEVRQCPKLTTTFATTSNGSMSAQSEVSQVAEGSSTGCSVPTSTYRTWTSYNGWEEEKEEEDGVR
nr:LOW QUALITY PROTEIN: probable disease resistance protein At4g27220 [Populus alba]